MSLEKIGESLYSIAFKIKASVTFSFPYEYEKRLKKDLSIHKSEEEKDLDQKEEELHNQHAALGKQIESAERFNNEDKVQEYKDKQREIFFKLEDIYEKRYDLEHASEYQKRVRAELPSINYANANASAVLEALGYKSSAGGELDVHDLLQRVTRLKNSLSEQKKMKRLEREEVNEQSPDRAQAFSPEFTSADIMNRVNQLAELAQKAVEAGVSEIHYG